MISNVGAGVKAVASNVPLADTTIQFDRIPGGLMTLKHFAEELVTLSINSEDGHRNVPTHMMNLNNSSTTDLTWFWEWMKLAWRNGGI